MRTSRIFMTVALFGVTSCGILLAVTALVPGSGIFATAIAALLAYAIWMNIIAACMLTGNFPVTGRTGSRVFGLLAATAGGMIMHEGGVGGPFLAVDVLGTLAILLCMPLQRNGASPREVAQPLTAAIGFTLFAAAVQQTLPQFTGQSLTMMGAVLAGCILAMWLWTRVVGHNTPASLHLLNPVPSLLASVALFGTGVSATLLVGAICLAWGACNLTRPNLAERDVARILPLHRAVRIAHARAAA